MCRLVQGLSPTRARLLRRGGLGGLRRHADYVEAAALGERAVVVVAAVEVAVVKEKKWGIILRVSAAFELQSHRWHDHSHRGMQIRRSEHR